MQFHRSTLSVKCQGIDYFWFTGRILGQQKKLAIFSVSAGN